MSNNENKSITPLRKYIAIGYAVIVLLIGGIVFIYLHEWRELERIEAESKEMNMLRQKVQMRMPKCLTSHYTAKRCWNDMVG